MPIGICIGACIACKTQKEHVKRQLDMLDPSLVPVRMAVNMAGVADVTTRMDVHYANYAPLLAGSIDEKEYTTVINGANELAKTAVSPWASMAAVACWICTLGFTLTCVACKQRDHYNQLYAYWENVKKVYNRSDRPVNWEYGSMVNMVTGAFRVTGEEKLQVAMQMRGGPPQQMMPYGMAMGAHGNMMAYGAMQQNNFAYASPAANFQANQGQAQAQNEPHKQAPPVFAPVSPSAPPPAAADPEDAPPSYTPMS